MITYKRNYKIFSSNLIYSERSGCFTGMRDDTPKMFINTSNFLYSFKNQDVYEANKGNYGEFYGNKHPFYISFYSNTGAYLTKLFLSHTLYTEVYNNEIELRDEIFTSAQYSNNYQGSGIISPSFVRKYRDWKGTIPKNSIKDSLYDVDVKDINNIDVNRPMKNLLRDKYLNIELWYNGNNKMCLFHNITEYQFLENDNMLEIS